MIQRIQTIFLLIASLVLSLLFVETFSFANIEAQLFGELGADGRFNIYDHPALITLTGLSILAFIVGIFLFKNRKQQRLIVGIGTILLFAFIGFGLYLWLTNSGSQESNQLSLAPGIANPLVALILGWLAIRSIRKDDRIVNSMDRLR